MTARFAKFGCFLFIIAVVALANRVHAQISPLQEFYQALIQNPSSPPAYENLRKVTRQIERLPPEEITKALPAIFAALAHQDFTVSGYAASALYSIALRQDSAELLRGHVAAIGNALTSPTPEARTGAIVILGTLKPIPPPEVVPIFLTFLKRTDADAQAQGSSVIFQLVHIAPGNPEVIAAIIEFLHRPSLDSKTKREAMVAVGNTQGGIKDSGIIAMITASMDDPDEHLRPIAIQTLAEIGGHALQQAEPALQRLSNDPNQPDDVRAAAKDALKKLHPNK